MPLTLLLLRHAKSSHADVNLGDHKRPLSSRGQRDAANIAQYMKEADLKPDYILCSTALRAMKTVEPILKVWGKTAVSYKDGLYLCSTSGAMDYLRTAADARRVLLVGHNPTMEDLLDQIVNRSAKHPFPIKNAVAKYPTGMLTELSIQKDRWIDLSKSCGQLIRFIPPRTLCE